VRTELVCVNNASFLFDEGADDLNTYKEGRGCVRNGLVYVKKLEFSF